MENSSVDWILQIFHWVNYGSDKPTMQKELLNVVSEFYNWLAKEFNPVKLHNELPLMMEIDGQLVNGIADLIVKTDDEIILIDYKTFIGDSAQMQWKAKTFSGQLKLYMDILKVGFPGKKVRGGIYFVMKGVVVWMGEREVGMAN